MQHTESRLYRRLHAATSLELASAGGVRGLVAMNLHAALGMAIYRGRARKKLRAAVQPLTRLRSA